ncbi:SPOSA6832_03034, partial [Sporobolomyces salmonicolor]
MPSKVTKGSSSDPSHVYAIGDIVLAKLKGFPAWPARVSDESDATPDVLKEKPSKSKNLHLEIDAYLSSSKRKGPLFDAYKVAQNPAQWLQAKADEMAEWEEQQAALAELEDEDQLASDADEAGSSTAADKSNKRKRDSTAGKKAEGDKKKKAKAEKLAKSRTAGGVKKDYTDDEAEPASKKAKGTPCTIYFALSSKSVDSDAETVKGWRHKLQKVFLGKSAPAAEEMPKCAEYFDAMEKFDMKKEWLVESKLAKVLKRIALLKDDSIPDEDKYSFRERSSALAAKWTALLGGSNAASSPKPAEATPTADTSADAAPAEDGVGAPREEEAKPAEETPAPAAAEMPEEQEEPAPMQVDAAPQTNGDSHEEPKDDESKQEEAPAATEPSETPAPAAAA